MQADEKQQKPQPEEKAIVEQKSEPKAEAVRETKLAKAEPKQVQKPEPSKPLLMDKYTEVFQAIQQVRQQDEKSLSVVPSALVAEKVIAVHQRTERDNTAHREATAETQVVRARDEQHIEPQRTDAFIHYQQRIASQEQPLAYKPENGRLPDSRSKTTLAQEFVSVAVYEQAVPAITDASPDVFQQTIDVVDTQATISSQEAAFDFGDIAQDVEPEIDTLTLPLAETAETDGIEAPMGQNVATDERLASQFEPEVIETYKELLALIEDEKAEHHELNESEESIAVLYDIANVLTAETALQEETKQDFETFLTLQPEAEEDVPLEIIIEQAGEQTLEQAFVQLARHLSDNLAENQDASEVSAEALPELSNEHTWLNTILQEIAEILPTCYSVIEETQEKRIQITPEMTQKLLMLLRSLGYEQPREVLIEFVHLYGIAFLFQAIQNIFQLSNANERQEFYTFSPVSSTQVQVAESNHLRLGKIIISLIVYKLGLDFGTSTTKQAA